MTDDLKLMLATPMALDARLFAFEDILTFLEFSEYNIEWQKRRELRRVEVEMKPISNEGDLSEYHHELDDGVLFRFDVALPMRVRYAALTFLISTIEWSMKLRRLSFNVPEKDKGKNETVHLLTQFYSRLQIPSLRQVDQLEFLIWVRNSIMHNSGVLAGYQYEDDIRKRITAYEPDFIISNWHFIGDTVEVRQGVIEKLVLEWRNTLRQLFITATNNRLISP